MPGLKDQCIEAAELCDFSAVHQTRYRLGGILPSEMHLFLSACQLQECELAIESGRKLGYSTEVLGRAGISLVSVDWEPLEDRDQQLRTQFPQAVIKRGLGQTIVRKHVKPGCAVLLDGPKGTEAVMLFRQVMEQVAFCAIHDMHASKPIRQYVQRHYKCFCSDDPEYTKEFGWLDFDAFRMIGKTREEATRDSFGLLFLQGGKWKN